MSNVILLVPFKRSPVSWRVVLGFLLFCFIILIIWEAETDHVFSAGLFLFSDPPVWEYGVKFSQKLFGWRYRCRVNYLWGHIIFRWLFGTKLSDTVVPAGRVSVSQLQGPWFYPELVLVSVQCFTGSICAHVGLPVGMIGVWDRWCSLMTQYPILGVSGLSDQNKV